MVLCIESSFFLVERSDLAFVTFCESNAKALLTASRQKCCLQAGIALSEGALGRCPVAFEQRPG
ncbi:MAG: hypothetical protein IKP38_04225, partial [Clostridia bacterium]|nr:hypothetical protein [Clostridia bacterium]